MPYKSPKNYPMYFSCAGLAPNDSATYYFGNISGLVPGTTITNFLVEVPIPGTIIAAFFTCQAYTATGTNENISLYVRKNDTTDALIQTVGAATAVRYFKNTAMKLNVVAGDTLAIKMVCPAWATNPDGIRFGGMILISIP